MDGHTPTEGTQDLEFMKKLEDEHCRLQRQVRMIQTDRLHRTMGVHPQFRREDLLLRTLKKDYLNLVSDLKIAKSGAHKKRRKRMENDLKNAVLLMVQTQMECEEGVIMMEQLEGVLQGNSQEMLRLKKLVNANKGQMQKRQVQSEHRLVSTENKLETAMMRFNAVQTENRKIRDEIEHMLKDRAIFNQAWCKMMGVLNKGKKFLQDLFESSTLAYDQRDEWCSKLKAVQEKGKVDQLQQVQEMRDLQKLFDHEMKIYHFLARKGVMRVNKKEEEREEELKRKKEEDLRKEYEKHAKILEDIHDYTQQRHVSKIIEDFQLKDHRNFSAYCLLTDYCAENEALSRDLAKSRRDVEDRRDWNEMMDMKRQTNLEKLRRALEEKQKKTEELRAKLAEREQSLIGTMEKIADIFRMLDCSTEPFQNLLGSKEPSLHQSDLTLRLISDRIKEYIETLYYFEHVHHKKSEKASTSRLRKYTIHPELPGHWKAMPITSIAPADPCPSCVEARWLSHVSEVAETPFDATEARLALQALASEPAYLRSDRVHALAECRVPQSRAVLARRYVDY